MNERKYVIVAAGVLGLAVLFLTQLSRIPFHPDEASLLYQSRDLEGLFQDPLELSYDGDKPMSRGMMYRALNAPLPKYMLGIGRRIFGVQAHAVATDWDWSAGWRQNIENGAMPPELALQGGRTVSSVMALAGALVIFGAGFQLGGFPVAIGSVFLYGTNGYILLHGRRSMAEGTLLFAVSLLLLFTFKARRWPALAGVAAGLAFASKHSALVMLALPVASLVWAPEARNVELPWRKLFLMMMAFVIVVIALTPFLWKEPLEATKISIGARTEFIDRQLHVTEGLAPGATLQGLPERLASLVGNTYLLPVQFQEVGNYRQELASAIDDYTNNSVRTLLVGPVQGTIRLVLLMLGIWGAFRWHELAAKIRRSNYLVLALGTAAMAGSLLAFNPLPYQRYYIPLLPLLVLWEATGFVTLMQGIREGFRAIKARAAGA